MKKRLTGGGKERDYLARPAAIFKRRERGRGSVEFSSYTGILRAYHQGNIDGFSRPSTRCRSPTTSQDSAGRDPGGRLLLGGERPGRARRIVESQGVARPAHRFEESALGSYEAGAHPGDRRASSPGKIRAIQPASGGGGAGLPQRGRWTGDHLRARGSAACCGTGERACCSRRRHSRGNRRRPRDAAASILDRRPRGAAGRARPGFRAVASMQDIGEAAAEMAAQAST